MFLTINPFGPSSIRRYSVQPTAFQQRSSQSLSIPLKYQDTVKFGLTEKEKSAIACYQEYDNYIKTCDVPSDSPLGKRTVQNFALDYMETLNPPISIGHKEILKNIMKTHPVFKENNPGNPAAFMYYITVFSRPVYNNHSQPALESAITQQAELIELGRGLS